MIFDDQSLDKKMEGVTTSRFGEVATKLGGGVYIWIAYRDYTWIIYGLYICAQVSNMVYFHPEILGKIPILTTMFQRGWFNHQLENNEGC